MARKPAHITILTFGSGYMSFARFGLRGDETPVASATELGPWRMDDGSLADALRDLVARHRLAGDRIFTVLPRHEATLRILDLPAQSPEELAGMVHLGAEELVPFPLDELTTDYSLLETLSNGDSRVLAVVVRNTAIEAHLALVRSAGLERDQVLLSTECLLAAMEQETGAGTAGHLYVSPDSVEVVILCGGTMVFGRCALLDVNASEGLTRRSREELAAEIRTSFTAFQREASSDEPFASFTASGEGVDALEIAEIVSAYLDTRVEAWSLPGGISPVALGALRIARGARRHGIGLMPLHEMKRRAAAVNRTKGVRVAAVMLAAILATVGVFAQAVHQRKAYLDELDAHVDQLRPIARTLRTKRQQLRLIEDQVDRTMSPLALFGEIARLAPDQGLNLTRYSFDREDGIRLNGSATDLDNFEGLIDGLRGPGSKTFPQFARAQELYRNTRVERGKKVWDFAVTIPFKNEAADE